MRLNRQTFITKEHPSDKQNGFKTHKADMVKQAANTLLPLNALANTYTPFELLRNSSKGGILLRFLASAFLRTYLPFYTFYRSPGCFD